MLFKSLASLALVATSAHAAIVNATDVYQDVAEVLLEFRAAGLVPQYIPEDNLKLSSALTVSYAGVQAELGSVLPRNDTLAMPTFTLNYTEGVEAMDPFANTLYTVMFLDAGAPGVGFPSSDSATVTHYISFNNTVTGTNGTLMNTSAPVTSYNPPTPPAGSGQHRYFQLVFAQPAGWMAPPAYSQPQPLVTNFSLPAFLKDADLGPIVAANYFIVENTAAPVNVTVSSTASVPAASVSAAVSSVSASIISAYSQPTNVAGSMGTKDAAMAPQSALSAVVALAIASIVGAALL